MTANTPETAETERYRLKLIYAGGNTKSTKWVKATSKQQARRFCKHRFARHPRVRSCYQLEPTSGEVTIYDGTHPWDEKP